MVRTLHIKGKTLFGKLKNLTQDLRRIISSTNPLCICPRRMIPFLRQFGIYIIESTAQKVGGYSYKTTAGHGNGTWNEEMGYGLIDVHAAVLKAINTKSIE